MSMTTVETDQWLAGALRVLGTCAAQGQHEFFDAMEVLLAARPPVPTPEPEAAPVAPSPEERAVWQRAVVERVIAQTGSKQEPDVVLKVLGSRLAGQPYEEVARAVGVGSHNTVSTLVRTAAELDPDYTALLAPVAGDSDA